VLAGHEANGFEPHTLGALALAAQTGATWTDMGEFRLK
jgi:hypothetical protein